MNDRKSSFKEIARRASEVPGIGKYDALHYDEKRIRPPRGISLDRQDRYTIMDEN